MEPFVVPSGWRKFVLPRRADTPAMPKVSTVKAEHAVQLVGVHAGRVTVKMIFYRGIVSRVTRGGDLL